MQGNYQMASGLYFKYLENLFIPLDMISNHIPGFLVIPVNIQDKLGKMFLNCTRDYARYVPG